MRVRAFSLLFRATVILTALETAVAIALTVSGSVRDRRQQSARDDNRLLVRELGLTDLALCCGTSYTRHPSQADIFAAHGEHPAAIEHFPSGSIVQPPPTSDFFEPQPAPGAVP